LKISNPFQRLALLIAALRPLARGVDTGQ